MSFDPALVKTPALQTKLPAVGTTIFTVMSALAAEKGAVNLGQGFPDFDCDPRLVKSVASAMSQEMRSKLSEPLAPTRRSGYSSRPGPCTNSVMSRATLLQMMPSV